MLKAQQLTYPPVLKEINLELSPGEMVALVGANGSGKSTLLRLLSGLLTPASGQVTLDGGRDFRTHLGLVFQNPESQLVANTVDEEVAFGPGQQGLSASELVERVEWALTRVGLWERRSWQSHALSAGQKQRLALAAVLACRPRYLLLDEPTSMLDPAARRELLELLRQLRGEVGILLITHRSEELEGCDRILHLAGGEIAVELTNASLWSAPERFSSLDLEVPGALRLQSWLADGRPARPFELLPANGCGALADCESLSYTYAGGTPLAHQALRQVTCRVPRGTPTALVGQTGSGKSTLLQHFNLLLRHQAGSLSLFDAPVTPTTPAQPLRRRMGMLFQQPESQFFQETVWDEVAYGPANFGLEVESHCREALEAVGLPAEQFAARSPFELSGGEQRRLALACVLAYRPEGLILDEPTAGLDRHHRALVWDLLRCQSASLVLISHDLEEVGELARHLIWLSQGQVVEQGPPEHLYPRLAQAGFEIPAWSLWAIQTFPEHSTVPVNPLQFGNWLHQSLDATGEAQAIDVSGQNLQ